MSFDPFLYVAFGLGWVVGRLLPYRGPWVPRATLTFVAVLLALLGASFGDLPLGELASVVPYAVALTLLVLATTAVVAYVLRERTRPSPPARAPIRPRFPSSVLLLVALLAGLGIGRAVAVPTGLLIPWALYGLLACVAFGLDLRWAPLKRAWVPLAAAAVGSVASAAALAFVVPFGPTAVFASALGFGWYSLTAPLVASRLGAALGLFAFLVNFLREVATILLAPRLGSRLRGEGLAALGGATSMDTTLYFVVSYGDSEAGSLALASGLVLTAAASLLVPLVLSLGPTA